MLELRWRRVIAAERPSAVAAHRNESPMNFQVDVSSALSATSTEPGPIPAPNLHETVDLLRQILEVQREQLACQRTAATAHDATSRWRAFLSRWQREFPDLADGCRKAMPVLERSYGHLIHELTARLSDDAYDLENEFSLQEFLDRYGMRLAQLGTILNLVAPLAEAGAQSETA